MGKVRVDVYTNGERSMKIFNHWGWQYPMSFIRCTLLGMKANSIAYFYETKERLRTRGNRCRPTRDNPFGELEYSFSVWRLLVSFIPMKDVYLDCWHTYTERKYYLNPKQDKVNSFRYCKKCGVGKGHKTIILSKKEPRR